MWPPAVLPVTAVTFQSPPGIGRVLLSPEPPEKYGKAAAKDCLFSLKGCSRVINKSGKHDVYVLCPESEEATAFAGPDMVIAG